MHGMITKIQKFSLHDGPGIRTTIFFKGCPLSCVWCHNPETISDATEVMFSAVPCSDCGKCVSVCPNNCFGENKTRWFNSSNCDQCGLCLDNCPTGALQGASLSQTSEEILAECVKDEVFYNCSGGGITLSGGEPLQQIDFCGDLVLKAKKLGLHVVVDTCGQASFDAFERILPFVDMFLYDIKLIDNELHKKHTGKPNILILDNFKKLCKSGKKIVVRVPIIPKITDSQENLKEIKNFVAQYNDRITITHIPFNILAVSKYHMLGKPYAIKGGA